MGVNGKEEQGSVGFKLTDIESSGEWVFRTGGGGSFIAAKSDISGPTIALVVMVLYPWVKTLVQPVLPLICSFHPSVKKTNTINDSELQIT